MSNSKPMFSIITVCYNAVDTIEKTILSVKKQGFKDYEHIIIDGGSVDGTIEIIDKYRNNFSVVVSESDNGIYDAMNKGVSFAKGHFIAILNADDYYLDNIFEMIFSKIEESNLYKNVVYYGNLVVFDYKIDDGYIVKPLSANKLSEFMCLNHPSCFVSKDLYETFSYNTEYKSAADQDLFLRFMRKNGIRLMYTDLEITAMKKGGESSKFLSILEIWKVQKNNKVNTLKRLKCAVYNVLTYLILRTSVKHIFRNIYKNFFSHRHGKY
jgi:glycosyltransferase involved in cell wall biosynthesis